MKSFGPVTLSEVKEALQELGGEETWANILDQVTKNRNNDYSYYRDRLNYETTAFQVVQEHCYGYKKYRGEAHFKKIEGKFRLITKVSKNEQVRGISTSVIPQLTPIAIDIKEPNQPERVKQEIYRILRDTELARMVKESNQYQCQICEQVLKLKDEIPYAEAHHIMPLGIPHNGPDVRDNILCVCPNCHVLLDYGAINLDVTLLKGIGKEYIDYHNDNIFGKA